MNKAVIYRQRTRIPFWESSFFPVDLMDLTTGKRVPHTTPLAYTSDCRRERCAYRRVRFRFIGMRHWYSPGKPLSYMFRQNDFGNAGTRSRSCFLIAKTGKTRDYGISDCLAGQKLQIEKNTSFSLSRIGQRKSPRFSSTLNPPGNGVPTGCPGCSRTNIAKPDIR